ncbi:hypothetical protein [Aquimarina longa]|nr:hypothetical protein [Aquimarina longa]
MLIPFGAEGNADVVYELIKDFNTIVSKEKIKKETIESDSE